MFGKAWLFSLIKAIPSLSRNSSLNQQTTSSTPGLVLSLLSMSQLCKRQGYKLKDRQKALSTQKSVYCLIQAPRFPSLVSPLHIIKTTTAFFPIHQNPRNSEVSDRSAQAIEFTLSSFASVLQLIDYNQVAQQFNFLIIVFYFSFKLLPSPQSAKPPPNCQPRFLIFTTPNFPFSRSCIFQTPNRINKQNTVDFQSKVVFCCAGVRVDQARSVAALLRPIGKCLWNSQEFHNNIYLPPGFPS